MRDTGRSNNNWRHAMLSRFIRITNAGLALINRQTLSALKYITRSPNGTAIKLMLFSEITCFFFFIKQIFAFSRKAKIRKRTQLLDGRPHFSSDINSDVWIFIAFNSRQINDQPFRNAQKNKMFVLLS